MRQCDKRDDVSDTLFEDVSGRPDNLFDATVLAECAAVWYVVRCATYFE